MLVSQPKANQPLGECDLNLASYPNQGISGWFFPFKFHLILLEKEEKISLASYTNNKVELHFDIKANLISEVTMNDR